MKASTKILMSLVLFTYLVLFFLMLFFRESFTVIQEGPEEGIPIVIEEFVKDTIEMSMADVTQLRFMGNLEVQYSPTASSFLYIASPYKDPLDLLNFTHTQEGMMEIDVSVSLEKPITISLGTDALFLLSLEQGVRFFSEDTIHSPFLHIYTTGVSQIQAPLNVDILRQTLRDESKVELSGQVGTLHLEGVHGSTAKLLRLTCNNVMVEIRHGASAFLSATEILDVELFDEAFVAYALTPMILSKVSDDAKLIKNQELRK